MKRRFSKCSSCMDDASPLPPSAATPDEDERQPVARWRWWIHLILIGGYILPRIVLGLEYPRDNPALSRSTTGLILVSLLELSVFALIFGIACLISKPTREQLFLRWRPGWWVLPLGIGYSIVIRLVAGVAILTVIVVMIATHVFTPASAQQFMTTNRPDVEKLVDVEAMKHNSAYFWLTVTLVSFVVAGLREELWRAGTLAAMKALWPRAFNSLGGQIMAISLIAVVFGTAHLQLGLVAAVTAGILGLFLGIIIVLHRSIWPAAIAHGMLDATTFALLPLIMQKWHELC
jgi:membrane protease YdiL (CAAX protease family)